MNKRPILCNQSQNLLYNTNEIAKHFLFLTQLNITIQHITNKVIIHCLPIPFFLNQTQSSTSDLYKN